DARWVVSRSYDWGNTFSPDVLASGWSSPTSDVCDCCPGSIVNSNDVVAMVYRDNNNNIRDSWAGLSYDGGETFAEGTNIDKHNWMISACPASGPEGVIVGDTLYSTFMNSASGKSLVYCGKLPLNDIPSASSETVLSNNTGVTLQNYPRISAHGNALGIVWKQYSGNKERVLLRLTNDVSKGFSESVDTVDIDNIENVDITILDSKVYIVWEDYGSGTVKFRSGEFSTVTAVSNIAENKFITAFPNPSVDHWTISGDFKQGTIIQLYKSNGALVKQHELHESTTNFKVGNSMLAPGVYILHVLEDQTQYALRLVK
ncbi:MAG: T9SS type A sorting domain-containing protein, partial [Saprospiraceae bacterium]